MINADVRKLKGNISVRKWCLIRQKVASDGETKIRKIWWIGERVLMQRDKEKEGGLAGGKVCMKGTLKSSEK